MRQRFSSDTRAVESIVGDLLLIGITVMIASVLVFSIALIPTPTDSVHASLSPAVGSGADGTWGTGDEVVSLQHGWGEALVREHARVIITVDGTSTTWSGDQLVSGFSDGFLRVGETWLERMTIQETSDVVFSFVDTRSGSQLVVNTILTPGNDNQQFCTSDSQAPTVAVWVQSPTDLSPAHSGAVDVTATAVDNCIGVDESATPHLYYSISAGAPGAFSDAGAMTLVGNAKWQGSIPSPGWSLQAGKTLYYYIEPLTDLRMNTGASQMQSDEIVLPTQMTYPSAHHETQGTVVNWNNLQSDADSGATAAFNEGLSAGYALVSQQNLTLVPAGSAHSLQLQYRTTTDTFQVEVWNHGSGTWGLKAPTLNSVALAEWSIALADAELSGGIAGGGSVLVRLTDVDPLGGSAGTLHIDYLRVETTL